jgi:hypothetical protein
MSWAGHIVSLTDPGAKSVPGRVKADPIGPSGFFGPVLPLQVFWHRADLGGRAGAHRGPEFGQSLVDWGFRGKLRFSAGFVAATVVSFWIIFLDAGGPIQAIRTFVNRAIALTGALIIGFELVQTHWFYLYIPWFLPFVFLAMLAPELAPAMARVTEHRPEPAGRQPLLTPA